MKTIKTLLAIVFAVALFVNASAVKADCNFTKVTADDLEYDKVVLTGSIECASIYEQDHMYIVNINLTNNTVFTIMVKKAKRQSDFTGMWYTIISEAYFTSMRDGHVIYNNIPFENDGSLMISDPNRNEKVFIFSTGDYSFRLKEALTLAAY